MIQNAGPARQEESMMAKQPRQPKRSGLANHRQGGVDALLEEILVDAYGDAEQLEALRQAFEDAISLPADAFVIGEPVSVLSIDYDGNERRGLTARCRREDGTEHVVAAADACFPPGSVGAGYSAAYLEWLGVDRPPATATWPAPATGTAGATETPLETADVRRPERLRRGRRHKATEEDVEIGAPVELVVLAMRENQAVRCRILGTEREITLRAKDAWNLVPGEIVTVRARKLWRYAGHPYLSGDVVDHRLEVDALGLVPLRLVGQETWDPREHYWGEQDEVLEGWARRIVARGPRPAFEMEQVLPGASDDPLADPIIEASELHAADESATAYEILAALLAGDLRCLDAHAHLGNWEFDRPHWAIRHYEAGLRIGELSLGDDFDGLLPWGLIDNRPFLRCLHGYGLCLQQLDRTAEAIGAFERMLWLNPTDNQGARFLLTGSLSAR